ncbi:MULTISPECIES: TolC family protein [unclassified Arcicella]|uniref:TolC family protein n=1 Tax=unclassified Arcicella TaxID=2644986 RepID=UPI00285F968C|nr:MULTISPECIES: TolC family protein [unclassified Arcicella]MDR6562264.1 outer membrane protein TolC [Arcicella sp. BE51]MDR6812042.1 outer membrane protein TolC [Arcicella sp. BE140]MDR6823353.1 outer membrane protein TolC [Arcicella sp. BE139]
MNFIKYWKVLTVTIIAGISLPCDGQNVTLTLQECRQLAVTQNKKIKAAQSQIAAAKIANEAAGLNNRPSFDASIMGVHVGKPLDKLLPPALLNGSVSATQPIYTGGKIKLGQVATSKAIEITEEQKTMTEVDVLFEVENAYWQIVQVKDKIVLANKYKEMLQQLHAELENAVNAGLTYKNDLLRVEVNMNEADLNIAKANDGLVLAKLNLTQIIGQSNHTDFDIKDSVDGNFSAMATQSFDGIADNRPEINLLKKAIEIEQIQTKLIKADLKPQIGFSLSGFSSVGKKINFSNGENSMTSYYGLLNVSIPIFDWGKNAKKVKEQTLHIQAKQWELEGTKELINLQAQSAWLQINQSVKKIALTGHSMKQAEENLRLANDRYKAGTITGKDVLEAQVIWQQAYSSNIDAKVEYKVNIANYKKAVGELR